jgi:hypothetical protein
MGLLSGIVNSFKNSDNIKNPLALGGSPAEQFGSKIGNFLGDVVDNVKKAAGEIAPQFTSKADAEDSLFNKPPKWLDDQEPESVGLDDRTGKTYPTMTHIRNFVRVELLRRQHNIGIMYPENGEYAGRDPMAFDRSSSEFMLGESNASSNSSAYTNDVVMFDYPKGPGHGLKAEMFMSDNYVGQTYKGPKAAWSRVVSNSVVKKPAGQHGEFHGFVLHGVDNFDESYGFVKPDGGSPGDCVIGYDCSKDPKPHFMEERDFKHRPPPGITGIDCEEMGVGKNQKKTTVKFTVWSRSQLDYVSPYFFTPGNTLLVEWGWNTFNHEGQLIDVTKVGSAPTSATGKEIKANGNLLKSVNDLRAKDPDYALKPLTSDRLGDKVIYDVAEGTGLVGLWNSSTMARKKIREGKGNYSFTLGMISNFQYSVRDDGGYDCTVEIMSMAYFATQLQLPASSQKPGENADPDDNRQLNIRDFVKVYLHEMITTGDENPDDWYDWGNDGLSDASYASMTDKYTYRNPRSGGTHTGRKFSSTLKHNNRYFSFGLTGGGFTGTDDNKEYMAGSPSDGSYITVGYLVDIFNVFYGRASETTDADIFQFKVEGKRCTAHPNIKSTDGTVLLIPNSMAPRHNLMNFKGTTIGLAGEGDKDGFNDTPINNSVAFDTLAEGGDNDPNTKAFIAVVQAMGHSCDNLLDAMNLSPRDDIHRLITLKPEYNDGVGVSHTADEDGHGGIRPFPDYRDLEDGKPSKGYSGRIQDLFVNYEVILDAVMNGQTATGMLKTILKKVSTAAGGIWDFDLVGEDPGNPNNTVLTIVDRRLSTNTVDEMQRSDKAYVFKAHQKNSIVRSMSCDVSIPGDVAGMVLYGKNTENANSNFYARKPQDRVLQQAAPLVVDGKEVATKAVGLTQGSKDLPSEEKFLMGIKVYHGATGIKDEWDVAQGNKTRAEAEEAASDATTGTLFTDASTGGLNLDEVGDADGVGGTKSGGSTDGWGWSEDGKVIDIEFVDPSKDRMLALMRKDKDPQNCIKYNMPLDGIELSLTLDGIEGIRLWDMFNCTGVPTKYYMNGLWRVTGVKHAISGNDWTTDITAQFAPNSADSFEE